MKRFLLIFFLPVIASAQSDCEDQFRGKDAFHIISTDYNPVCGCDGETYRNSDAAYWWGGINYWTSNTICDDFDIDLYPNVSTSDVTIPAHLRIYMKYPGTASLTIYNDFGKLMLQRRFETSLPEQVINDANPYDLYEVQTFPRGIYILIVTVNGNKKYRKIIRVTE